MSSAASRVLIPFPIRFSDTGFRAFSMQWSSDDLLDALKGGELEGD
jgi:hypothetical protein